jgi:predicted  nucleic acid-binding Zn-ribbon protein
LLFYIFLTVANFSDFDEALCKLSSFEVESYRKTYTLKTSILGKVTAMWLQEREEVINKMSIEPKKLKREFNLAQAANIDLEKKVVDLVDALKKCQDEKKIAEDALESSQKEVERLKKTYEDDIKLIENLCQDSDKSVKTIDELRSAKTELSTRN